MFGVHIDSDNLTDQNASCYTWQICVLKASHLPKIKRDKW